MGARSGDFEGLLDFGLQQRACDREREQLVILSLFAIGHRLERVPFRVFAPHIGLRINV